VRQRSIVSLNSVKSLIHYMFISIKKGVKVSECYLKISSSDQ